jgi:hypothetical protein
MKIREFVWTEDRIEQALSRSVRPDEVEEVCFGQSLVLQEKAQDTNPVYYVLGQTRTGRYLLCIVTQLASSQGYLVTTRRMTTRERQQYQRWKQS